MSTDIVVLAIGAILCLWLGTVLLCAFVKMIVRRELRKFIDRLGKAKFVLQRRDEKGRFTN